MSSQSSATSKPPTDESGSAAAPASDTPSTAQPKRTSNGGGGTWTRASASNAVRPAVVSVLLTITSFLLVYVITRMRLPNPQTYKPSASMPFDHVNARKHIAHMGRRLRFVSTAGLGDAVSYIYTEMDQLSAKAKERNLHFELDMFHAGPSSFSTSVGVFPARLSYDNVSSVVLRLSPNDEQARHKQALLINAHVDSAIGAPGVNDELSGVGIMMDIVRALVSTASDSDSDVQQQNQQRLTRPVIFLFNAAEEVLLLGSHSFVTQHPWARNIAAHINLESLGSGNEYHLFRLGPNNPWLAHAYAKAVSVPFTSVAATDVFETKTIPGETDFRAFDEYGGIPGYDFVFLGNGYIYHTMSDDINHLNDQGLLHAGITVYELMMELAGNNDAIGVHLAELESSTEIKSSATSSLQYYAERFSKLLRPDRSKVTPSDRKVAFFDVLHMFTIVYDEELATLFHSLSVVLTVLVWLYKLGTMTPKDWMACVRMLVVFIVSIFCGLMSSTYIAVIYARILRAQMIWYGEMFRATLMFGLPTFAGICTGLLLTLPRRLSRTHFEHTLFAFSFIHTAICIALIRANAMSAYAPASVLILTAIISLQYPRVSALARYFQLIIGYAIISCRMFTNTMAALLPVIGRVSVGPTHHIFANFQVATHDIITSIVVCLTVVLYFALPLMPILANYAPALRRLRSMAIAGSLWSALIMVVIIPRLNGHSDRYVITPYSTHAPKRLTFMHFYSPQMFPSSPSSSVIQISATDAVDVDLQRLCADLATESVDEGITSLAQRPTFGSFDVHPSESFHPFGKMLHHKHWLRSGNVPLLEVPSVRVESESRNSQENTWNISIAIQAPDSHQVTVRLRSKDHVDGIVTDWSLDCSLEDSTGYVWVKHHGTTVMKLWMIVRGDDSGREQRPKVTMAISNCRFGTSRSPKDLAVIASKVEDWESGSFMVATAAEIAI